MIISLCFWIMGLGESGLNPVQLLLAYPLLLVTSCCTIIIDIFYCFAIKYIPITLGATITSASGIVPFFAVLIIFLFTNTGIESITTLQVFGAIFCVVGFFSVIIFRKRDIERDPNSENDAGKKSFSAFMFGIILALFSMVFDSADSVTASWLFGAKLVDEYDVMTAYLVPSAVTSFGLYIYICIKEKKLWNCIDLKNEKFNQSSAWLEQMANYTCVFALAGNPLFANLIIGLYGAGVAVVARAFLKEKLSKEEYISLALMLIGITCFTISESVI